MLVPLLLRNSLVHGPLVSIFTFHSLLPAATTLCRRLSLSKAGSNSPTTIEPKMPSRKSSHNVAVCIVPPDDCAKAWDTISTIRSELRDPNFFRWPPHINLLYPFIEPIDDAIVDRLASAFQQCEPFEIRLQRFGTFGGKNRGVLWLDPEATELENLHSSLTRNFPECSNKRTAFRPHMTVSHFESVEAADNARVKAATLLPDDGVRFFVDRVCLIRRVGDDGQFMRVAELSLGDLSKTSPQQLIDPKRFPLMPDTEADWTREERMKLKDRRKR